MAPAPPLRDSDTVSPLRTNLQVANFQMCEHDPVCQLLWYTTVLFKVLYYKIKNIFFKNIFKIFAFVFGSYELFVWKYYKPTVWYYELFMWKVL